jgi:UDP-N-acetylmuramoyl-L-alanyl-D-glutamate--2,6-diaminopimelate ligase
MKLYELMKGIAEVKLPDQEISGVTSDTRSEIKPGTIFVCIKGGTFDGHDAAQQMLDKGCSVVVCERDLGLGDTQIIVDDTRGLYPMICAAWFGDPQ